MSEKVCVVAGVGPGNGAAIARRFAKEGYRVALLARRAEALAEFEREIPGSKAYPCDVSDEAAVNEVFARIVVDLGPIDALVYNAGSGVWGSFDKVEPAKFEESWRSNVMGLLITARAAVPGMKGRGGFVGVVGAGAALRGRAMTAAFAQAKAAQRSLAQSMARQLGPDGVHVCYLVLDAVVDLPSTRAQMADKPESFFLKPDDLAGALWDVANQPRSAWTFEFDLRPFGESW